MINQIILFGRICNDLEIKSTPAGVSVLSFRIAVQRNYKNKDGNYDTDFINCVAFKSTADFIDNYFSKGDLIAIIGTLQSRTWEHEGKKHYIMEVIINSASFVSSREKREEITNKEAETQEGGTKLEGIDTGEFETVSDDDLPF